MINKDPPPLPASPQLTPGVLGRSMVFKIIMCGWGEGGQVRQLLCHLSQENFHTNTTING